MAETEAEDRTQAPSERRRLRAREEGQAALSRELGAFGALAAATLILFLGGPPIAMALTRRLGEMLVMSASPGTALEQAWMAWLAATVPLLGAVALTGAGLVLLQSGFLVHAAAAMPDLARLDPRRGLKRLFGLDNAAETGKSLIKLAVLAWAFWAALAAIWPTLPIAALWTPATLMDRLTRDLMHLVLLVLGLQAAIAVLDVSWTRWRFTSRLRMSREDLKQEHRESEGDPKVKGRLRQLRQLRSRQRMLAAVARATVVVTNPTHYAIALAYERGAQAAPKVVAKGVDDVAARIRAAAEKAGVPLVANPPLARALYAVPLDAEVPAEHFRLVAEIIAYVWRLRTPGSNVR